MRTRRVIISMVLLICLSAISLGPAQAQQAEGVNGTSIHQGFTYQGQLYKNGMPYTGTCDFSFGLYDASTAGNLIGQIELKTAVTVTKGVFSVLLNELDQFGATPFDGTQRFLDVQVTCPGDAAATSLGRQLLTNTPYASYAANANQLGGLPASVYQKHPSNVIIVAKSGGDYNTINAALSSIPSSGGSAPSASNPYLVWVGPGVYNEAITMRPYINIRGAGQTETKITSVGVDYAYYGTVTLASNVELSDLTVENTGGATFATRVAIALYGDGTTAVRLTRLTILANGVAGSFASYGIYLANNSATPSATMTQLDISASGGSSSNTGIISNGGTHKLSGMSITVNGTFGLGISSNGSSQVQVVQSQITGSPYAFYLAGGAIRVAGSQVSGSKYVTSGTVTCVNAYDANFGPLGVSC